ncbi:Uncharacterised protein [Vibrio cholerae]|nr:Uncharacterised protein [Vibrio cholerae]
MSMAARMYAIASTIMRMMCRFSEKREKSKQRL